MAKGKKEFALYEGGMKDLRIEYQTKFMTGKIKQLTIWQKGQQIASTSDGNAVAKGYIVQLPSGEQLMVKFKGGLIVEADGEPLEGSVNNPKEIVKAAAYAVGFLSVVNLGAGFLAIFGNVEFLIELGFGWITVIFGGIFGLLAVGITFYSWVGFISLLIATGLYLLDSVLIVILAASGGGIGGAGIGLRVVILYLLFRAFKSSYNLARGKDKQKPAYEF